jgi:hypothetical protein
VQGTGNWGSKQSAIGKQTASIAQQAASRQQQQQQAAKQQSSTQQPSTQCTQHAQRTAHSESDLKFLIQPPHDVSTGQNRFPEHNGLPRRGLLGGTSGRGPPRDGGAGEWGDQGGRWRWFGLGSWVTDSPTHPVIGHATGARRGGQCFNGLFGTWDQATNLTSHSKSTKQSLNY